MDIVVFCVRKKYIDWGQPRGNFVNCSKRHEHFFVDTSAIEDVIIFTLNPYTPNFLKLHALRVKFCTIYKTLLLTFIAQRVNVPLIYVSEMCHHYSPTRTLRSSQHYYKLQYWASSVLRVKDHFLMLLHFFGKVFLCIFARLVLYTVLSLC